MDWSTLLQGRKNAVFLGEAGCGKSELAMNLSLSLARAGKTVHLFDMDQTKPLFRSRDAASLLRAGGVQFHYEEQFADAPTMVGGVTPALLDGESYTVLDVGGDYIGARAVGGFAHLLKRPDTAVFYVINCYRAWSGDLLSIDGTLSAVLKAARLQQVQFLANPNLGVQTTDRELLEGLARTKELLAPYAAVQAGFAPEQLAAEAEAESPLPLIPIRLYLGYPWQEATCNAETNEGGV